MTVEFKLPDLGENIAAGDVVNVLVAVGDTLAEDQPVIELETDKAVIEVPSSVTGVIEAIHVKKGDKVAVGQVVLTAKSAEDTPAANAPAPAPAPVAAPKAAPVTPAATGPAASVQFVLPDLGENIAAGDVVKVLVAVGDTLAEDQPVIELETDKAVIEVPSSVSGVIEAIHVKKGDKAAVGQAILTVKSNAQAAPLTQPASPVVAAPTPQTAAVPVVPTPAPAPPSALPIPAAARPLVPAAPSVRRLARELGIDIAQVKGAGPGGRVSQEDVKSHVRQLNTQRPAPGTSAAPAPLPDFNRWGAVDRQPLSKVRLITAERLLQAWTTIPQVTQFDKADITEVEQWRKEYGKRAEAAGGKLTLTAILLKVAAAALRRFPQFNASLDMAHHEVVYKQYCHVGVAVDTDRGLLVPVVRDVDHKNIVQLAAELAQLAEKARTRKLSPEDMQGGCFTISNLGGIGGTGFTPIINPPEVAILGVARGSFEPVWNGAEFKPRLLVPLSLSYDHRLIDGADGIRFLRWLAEALQNPFLLLLEG